MTSDLGEKKKSPRLVAPFTKQLLKSGNKPMAIKLIKNFVLKIWMRPKY